jgi:Zn-dependent peptidase ImmA (M78 family)
MNRRLLAAQAARQAALIRSSLKIGLADAICPFDVAQRLGLATRFLQAPSLEGLYFPEPRPTVVVGSERPSGRQRFTCAHEIGHHVFRHGICFDETAGLSSNVQEEFLADQFSAALLMPKVAVDAAFFRRGVQIKDAAPAVVLEVSQDLGVGFSTLITHLEFALQALNSDTAGRLRRSSLPTIRKEIAGFGVPHELFVVNSAWGARPLDMQVGDIATVPIGAAYQGTGAAYEQSPIEHLKAIAPGLGQLTLRGRSEPIALRVSRRSFTGLARYRHLEECAND